MRREYLAITRRCKRNRGGRTRFEVRRKRSPRSGLSSLVGIARLRTEAQRCQCHTHAYCIAMQCPRRKPMSERIDFSPIISHG